MALFTNMNEDGGNPKFVRARREYLHAIEAVLGTAGHFDVILPSADDLEAALELITPPEYLSPTLVGRLQAAMRAELATHLRMAKEREGWAL